jgi:spoIIIJ-associated protein
MHTMEWVETTAKTIDAAREAALDQLGVAADEAEFDVIEEPRPGLFGRVRGEARLRARIRPAQVRPKQERRRRGRTDKASDKGSSASQSTTEPLSVDTESTTESESASKPASKSDGSSNTPSSTASSTQRSGRRRSTTSRNREEPTMTNDASTPQDRPESTVTPDEVGAAAVTFVEGLTSAFGATATVELEIDGIELDVRARGAELGLLVGPGGRTLNAVQDLARVAAQRRLGDHETRLRIDVAGYRERREAALSEFARDVAEQVRTSGTARSLEPMTSADRKVVHDVLNEESAVASRSVGEDPDRRIIVEPA